MRSVLVALLLLAGCVTAPLPQGREVVLNQNLQWASDAWLREARTRFDDPIVVLVHGGTLAGEWFAFPDDGPPIHVEAMARLLHKLYGSTRPIVLITCNQDALPLNVPNTFYATWVVQNPPAERAIWKFKG